MGTNYDWYANDKCPHCGRESEPLHIGHSPAGWAFSLHVWGNDVKDKPHNFLDWVRFFARPGSEIKDEYGRSVSINDMVKIIQPAETPRLRGNVGESGCIGWDGNADLITGDFC